MTRGFFYGFTFVLSTVYIVIIIIYMNITLSSYVTKNQNKLLSFAATQTYNFPLLAMLLRHMHFSSLQLIWPHSAPAFIISIVHIWFWKNDSSLIILTIISVGCKA